MKKTTIALAALAFSGAVLAGGPDPMVAPAAQDTLYLGFHADMTQAFYQGSVYGTYDNYSTPMGFHQGGFQLGMLFGAIRAELSVDYGTYGGSDLLQSYLSAFVKGAYDLSLGHGVAVYPVAGIGLAHAFEQGSSDAGKSDTSFAWLLGAGATLALNDKTSISGEYNWVNSTRDSLTISSNQGQFTVKDFGANVFSIRWNRSF